MTRRDEGRDVSSGRGDTTRERVRWTLQADPPASAQTMKKSSAFNLSFFAIVANLIAAPGPVPSGS